jgi:hypothetical protein
LIVFNESNIVPNQNKKTMKNKYKSARVKNNLLTKIKNTFYGIVALCFINSTANAQAGAALNFDGVNDYCNSAVFSSITNNITLQAKVYWSGTNGSQQFILYNGNSGANGYGLFLPAASNQVNYLYGGLAFSGLFTLTPNTWTSISMVITTNLLTIYKDGVLTNSIVIGNPAVPFGGSFVVGSGPVANTTFNGTIDEVLFWNVARTQCEVISYLNCEIPTSAAGLLANYHFNQGLASGSNGTVTSLTDASGNVNNLVLGGPFALTGSTSNWVAPGAVVSGFTVPTTCSAGGEALDFDGVNDHVVIPHNAALNLVNLYTFEAWVNPSVGAFRTILGKGDGNGNPGNGDYIFQITNTGQLALYATVNNSWKYSSVGSVPNGSWSHVAVTNDGTNVKFYVNGALNTTSAVVASANNPGTNPFYIGRQGSGTGNNNLFFGDLDQVRVWNVARTQCEINTFKNCEIPTSAPGLVSNYHFNSGFPSGNNTGITTLYDLSGNGFNGALTNFALTGTTSNWISPGAVASGFTTALAPLTPSVLASSSTTLCAPNSVSLTASNNASALIFNGTSGNISIPHNSNQVPTAEMTIEGWIYPLSTGTVNTNMIMMKGNYGYGLALGASGCSGGAKLNYWTSPSCGTAITSSGSVPFNAWSHVAVVVKLSPVQSLEFFINGISAGTATTGININNGSNQALILGMQGTGCSCNYFSGRMDEIRLWSSARTQAQIIANMNTSIAAASPSLQLYLKADNSFSTTVSDLSSNATNGTIISGVTWEVPSSAPVNVSSNYLWSTAATTSVVNINTSSVNSVTITTATGCTSTASQTVTVNAQPTVSVNSGSICSGSSFSIVPSGASTYTISGGSSVVTPTSNASYNVIGTSSLGCISSNTAVSSVTVNALPTVSVNSGAICAGNSFTIIPTGVSTYTISGGSSVVNPTSNTSYNVIGTSSFGCLSNNTAVSSVTVNALPTVSVSSGAICSGNTFTINATGTANTYSYSGGSTVVTPTATTNYTITGTNTVTSCSNTAISSVTVNALPTLSAASSTSLLCIGESASLTASGATTYTWNTNANTTVIAISPSITSTYTVNGTDANGCSNVATITQSVSTCTSINNLSSNISDLSFLVYPNPSNGVYTIEMTSALNVSVIDVLGKVVYSQQSLVGKHSINLSNLNNGLYILKSESNGTVKTVRLIKE